MSEERQNIQLRLAFPEGNEGEALQDSGEGTHALAATTNTDDPVKLVNLMEEVLDRQNLNRAYRQILSNKGARTPGVDGITVKQLLKDVQKHWPKIEEQLRGGTCRPLPVKRVEIPKPGGGVRKLGIPSALDRLLQQAVLQVLTPIFDPTFSARSYGFRPGRSTHQAIAKATLASVSRFVERKLRLKVNREKSAVDRPWRRKFLGFSLTNHRQPRRRIAPASIDRFKQRIRGLTRRTRGCTLEDVIEDLTRYLRGWLGYFGFCQTQSVLRDLESWLHRRLRALMWKRGKRGTVRFAELRKRGVSHDLAAQSAGSSHSVWRLSRSPALSFAFPGKFWKSLGLPALVTQ